MGCVQSQLLQNDRYLCSVVLKFHAYQFSQQQVLLRGRYQKEQSEEVNYSMYEIPEVHL